MDLEKFVQSRDELSGADIKAVCTEAGMLALRERRMKVCQEDFVKAKEKALYRKKGNVPEGLGNKIWGFIFVWLFNSVFHPDKMRVMYEISPIESH